MAKSSLIVLILSWISVISWKPSFLIESRNQQRVLREMSLYGAESEDIDPVPKSPHQQQTRSLQRNAQVLLCSTVLSEIFAGPESVEAVRTKGYRAIQSVYAPQSTAVLYRPPLLAQSALLNSLPVKNELIGQVQAYLESFLQLLNPNVKQRAQIASSSSVLWTNLQINAQRAAGMFLYNAQTLREEEDAVVLTDNIPRKKELQEKALNDLTKDLLNLVNASRRADAPRSLLEAKCALKHLCDVGSYLIPVNSTSLGDVGLLSSDSTTIPRLKGRATVTLTVGRRNAGPKDRQYIKMVVDGTNYPISAGAFIELCKKSFYNGLPIVDTAFKLPELDGEIIDGFTGITLGDFPAGYRDIYGGGRIRRIPLETLRSEANGTRITITGAARNSQVFTRAQPVHSFGTPGAVALLHPVGDRNGASSTFFVLRPKSPITSEILERIDKRFAIFAYIVEGLDVLNSLGSGDSILDVEVDNGAWQLVKLVERPGVENTNNNGISMSNSHSYSTLLLYSGFSEDEEEVSRPY